VISVGGGLLAGSAAYAAVVLKSGITEAHQIVALFARRLPRREPPAS
jgi:hypothetical protein